MNGSAVRANDNITIMGACRSTQHASSTELYSKHVRVRRLATTLQTRSVHPFANVPRETGLLSGLDIREGCFLQSTESHHLLQPGN